MDRLAALLDLTAPRISRRHGAAVREAAVSFVGDVAVSHIAQALRIRDTKW